MDDHPLLEKYRFYNDFTCYLVAVFIETFFLPSFLAGIYRLLGRQSNDNQSKHSINLAARYLMITTLSILAHTGLALKITIFPKLLPNTCEGNMALVGGMKARGSWPCQREEILAWYTQAKTSGSVDLRALLEMAIVEKLFVYLIVFVILYFTEPYASMAVKSFWSAKAQRRKEERLEKASGLQTRLKEQELYDRAVGIFWGTKAKLRVQARYTDSESMFPGEKMMIKAIDAHYEPWERKS